MLGIFTIYNPRHNPEVAKFIREHIDLSLGKFDDRITRMEIRVLDENAGKGGDDKVCTIDVKLGGLGQYHVRAKTDDVYASVLRAIHKVDALISKKVDRYSSKTRIRHQHGGVKNATTDLLECVESE